MYNASVYELIKDPSGALRLDNVFTAELDNKGRMIRSNALQCTGFEGTHKYHEYYVKTHPDVTLEIVKDDCLGYKSVVGGYCEERKTIRTSIEFKHRKEVPTHAHARPRGYDGD